MDSLTNNRSLKISGGKCEVPTDLEWPMYDIHLKVVGDITKKEFLDNQDGTIEVVWTLKATSVEVEDERIQEK